MFELSLTNADATLLIIAAFFVAVGTYRGLSGEITSLASFVGGSYLALTYPDPLASILKTQFALDHLTAKSIAIPLIFLLFYFIVQILGKYIKSFIKITHLTLADRIAGFLSGSLKAYLTFIIIYVLFTLLSPIFHPKWVQNSSILKLTAETWPLVLPILEEHDLLPKLDPSNAIDFIDGLSPKKRTQSSDLLNFQKQDKTETKKEIKNEKVKRK